MPCLDAGKRQLSSAVEAGEVIHLPCLLFVAAGLQGSAAHQMQIGIRDFMSGVFSSKTLLSI